jgi:flagellar FliJ protein
MPAKFEFRLQPLLDWRKRIEAEKQREFAACRRVLEECIAEIEWLRDARRRCGAALAASAATRPATELRLHDAYLRAIDAALAQERRRRAKLESVWRRARDELIAATRGCRVIEKLKERLRGRLQAEEARRDELALDDANARRHERAVRERLAQRRAESAAP